MGLCIVNSQCIYDFRFMNIILEVLLGMKPLTGDNQLFTTVLRYHELIKDILQGDLIKTQRNGSVPLRRA